jgi:hypothetical protein
MLKAIETTGFVNAQHQLRLNDCHCPQVLCVCVVTEEEMPTSNPFQTTYFVRQPQGIAPT